MLGQGQLYLGSSRNPDLCYIRHTRKDPHTVPLPRKKVNRTGPEQGSTRFTVCQILKGPRLRLAGAGGGVPEPYGVLRGAWLHLQPEARHLKQADLCVSERMSVCRGRHHVLPANGPILVTICSRERDTCQKQLLTADRRWGVLCGGLELGTLPGPQECQLCALCGGRQ